MAKPPVNFYDDQSFDYQDYWEGREYESESEKVALKKLFALIPNKESLIDIGGGFGRLAPLYAPDFKKCLLVDPAEKLLNQAKELCQKYQNFQVKKGVVEKLPAANNQFTTAIIIRTLHHLYDPQKAIEEIARILKPNGYLILEFANKVRFKRVLESIFHLNLNFFLSHRPVNLSQKNKKVPFFNYHPNQIKSLLLANHFEIKKILSVSNFRIPWLKKIVPLKPLITLELFFLRLISSFPRLTFFGPSILVLARKSEK